MTTVTKIRRRPSQPPPHELSTLRYLETSTVLAALIDGDAEAQASIREIGTRVTSEVTFVEAHRVIVRGRATRSLTDAEARTATRNLRALERRVGIVKLSAGLLDRLRRPFLVEPVRTLDGIHLATIDLLAEGSEPPIVVTRDRRIRANAKAAGMIAE